MTHGLMFHYFWDERIKKTQGSVSGKEFEKILDFYSLDHNILPAEEYLEKAKQGKLKGEDVCITFDDGLYSQWAVADPILKERNLTAFYFVYTSPMEGKFEKLEVYRMFRNSYETIEYFYQDFFNEVLIYGQRKNVDYTEILESEEARGYHSQYAYYNQNDRIFRYLRDVVFYDKYDVLMEQMMKKKGFNPLKECKNIWISQNDLKKMRIRGNVIGLHSHTHPTTIAQMSYDEKYWEYEKNKKILEDLLGGGKNSIISL